MMFFAKRKCAARIMGMAGLPLNDQSTMILINMIVAEAKAGDRAFRRNARIIGSNLRSPEDQDLVNEAALHLDENPTAVIPLVRSGLTEEEARTLLTKVAVAGYSLRALRLGQRPDSP